jgi:hypothetical protein
VPFTFSHPAAVLPLLRAGRGRGPLIASGLVAGSLAPDLPFFLDSPLPGVYGLGRFTHRAWAVPTLDVALAAALAAAWHGALRETTVALLPPTVAGPVDALTAPRRKPQDLGPGDAVWFAASAAIGAFTHVGWDAFTHHGRWGERHWPSLGHRIGGRMPVYQALQWTTSALGLAALGVAARRALAATPPATARPTDPAAPVSPAPTLTPGDRATGRGQGQALGPVRRIFLDQPGLSGAVHRKAEGRPRTGCTWPRPTTQRGAVPGKPGPGRSAGQALVAAGAALGALHRLRRERARHPGRRLTGNDLVGAVTFGGGAGAALGAAGWALSALRSVRDSNMTDREREPAPWRG